MQSKQLVTLQAQDLTALLRSAAADPSRSSSAKKDYPEGSYFDEELRAKGVAG